MPDVHNAIDPDRLEHLDPNKSSDSLSATFVLKSAIASFKRFEVLISESYPVVADSDRLDVSLHIKANVDVDTSVFSRLLLTESIVNGMNRIADGLINRVEDRGLAIWQPHVVDTANDIEFH
jgi:hypothetical protein